MGNNKLASTKTNFVASYTKSLRYPTLRWELMSLRQSVELEQYIWVNTIHFTCYLTWIFTWVSLCEVEDPCIINKKF